MLNQRRGAENFPVALRILPRGLRRDLVAVYDVVRTIDDLGDDFEGDRVAALDGFRADLRRVWTDDPPAREVLASLVPTVRAHRLDREPFEQLIEANRRDQVKTAYGSWAELAEYCAYSAEPIGRIVLAVLDRATPRRVELSDRVCTALQVLEHCQDVGEDRRRGRTYLPGDALVSCGVSTDQLDADRTSPQLRAVLSHLVTRAERLLDAAPELVGSLSGAGRLAVAGFAAGGRATADALRRADFDVLAKKVRPRRRDIARHAMRLLVAR